MMCGRTGGAVSSGVFALEPRNLGREEGRKQDTLDGETRV